MNNKYIGILLMIITLIITISIGLIIIGILFLLQFNCHPLIAIIIGSIIGCIELPFMFKVLENIDNKYNVI